MPQHFSADCPAQLAGEPAERTIDRLERSLIRAQQRATLGTLAAVIAHEFNNLLTPVLPWVDLALGTLDPADMRKALERVRTQARRAEAVTRRLLELAEGRTLPSQPCPVAAAVEEAILTATRPFEKDGIALSVNIPGELRVQAEPHLLVQALLNLLLNARAAMKSIGGTLLICAHRDGDVVIIDIRDSGCGIPADHLENFINPFLAGVIDEPPDEARIGLGLTVCRLIAHKHGASIQALPNPDRGCTFRLRWPAA